MTFAIALGLTCLAGLLVVSEVLLLIGDVRSIKHIIHSMEKTMSDLDIKIQELQADRDRVASAMSSLVQQIGDLKAQLSAGAPVTADQLAALEKIHQDFLALAPPPPPAPAEPPATS